MLTNRILSAYIDNMVTPDKLAAQASQAQDPGDGLRAVAALRRLADDLEVLHVGRARELGWTWQQMADALGVTRQAVHRKHVSRLKRRYQSTKGGSDV